ncbi:hypothetical protein AJ79_07612 [Helicocarpus griseus UAMH5409]|uniref:Uncharacterized protein n=1 Tax=Helicocarpus griseus UAMH5409 TaxID=1447875 RepID=A0A2B7X0S8_9EURO|nr:hypothetical protein AJ79_07612 [Helicocarpus griseus UAMH5409]
MLGPTLCRPWLPAKPRLSRCASSAAGSPSPVASQNSSDEVTLSMLIRERQRSVPRPEPSPSELLRFAVTGTLRTPIHSYYSETREKYIIEAFSKHRLPSGWTVFNPPSAKMDGILNKFDPPVDRMDPSYLSPKIELPTFHALLETYVRTREVAQESLGHEMGIFQHAVKSLAHNTRADQILITMNAIYARYTSLGVDFPLSFYALGMECAARQFSAAAFQAYLTGYINAGGNAFSFPYANQRFIRNLKTVCLANSWEDRQLNLAPMREIVTGLDANGSPLPGPSLYSFFFESGNEFPESEGFLFVQLLGLLGDNGRLLDLWPTVQNRLKTDPSSNTVRNLVVLYLKSLLMLGFSSRAVDATCTLSKIADLNEFFPEWMWTELLEHDEHNVLRDIVPSKAKEKLLYTELHSIESRLGIEWNAARERHVAKTQEGHMDLWLDHWFPSTPSSHLEWDSGLPESHLRKRWLREELKSQGLSRSSVNDALFASSLFGSSWRRRRLFEEVRLHGSSRSSAKLSMIANLLHDFEGRPIPLGFLPVQKDDVREVAWFPECSPIEFSNNRPSLRHDMAGPQSPSSLGLVRARRNQRGESTRYIATNRCLMQLGRLCDRRPGKGDWTDTGHIILWDTYQRRLKILFLGKSWGTIDPGLYPQERHPFLPGVATFRIESLKIFKSSFRKKLTINKHRYWLEVDSAEYLDS